MCKQPNKTRMRIQRTLSVYSLRPDEVVSHVRPNGADRGRDALFAWHRLLLHVQSVSSFEFSADHHQ